MDKTGNGNSFLFSLREDGNFIKLKCLKKESEFIYNKDWIACFGETNGGFKIGNDCNIQITSSSDLGNNYEYEVPKGIQPYTESSRSYLAGLSSFLVEEIEVFKII